MATDSSSNSVATEKHWLVWCLSYAGHQCKPWFGYPAQVWSASLNADFNYFLLKKISSRVVFVKSKISGIIGEHNVIVALPIPFYFDTT